MKKVTILLINKKPELSEQLNTIEGIKFYLTDTQKLPSHHSPTHTIDLSGADNEGIVEVLSKYLVGKSINIIEMETHISNAPVTGTPLFNLMAITTIPSNIDLSEIQSDLSLIAQKLGVEITVNQSENMVETV